jgi:hypothetical protein
MAVEVLSEDPVRRYSPEPPRSLITMLSRRARGLVNGSASHVLVRPFVVFAARALGPGPTRLKLVRLAHNLDDHPRLLRVPDGSAFGDHDGPAVQPTTRAA